jgi:hypothetical protein
MLLMHNNSVSKYLIYAILVASDQEVRQENEEDEISNEHVNRIEESVDQNDYTGTLTDTVASEIGKCESENDDVEVNVSNQDQSQPRARSFVLKDLLNCFDTRYLYDHLTHLIG